MNRPVYIFTIQQNWHYAGCLNFCKDLFNVDVFVQCGIRVDK